MFDWRFFIVFFSFACQAHTKLNQNQILLDVKTLASDEFEGRKAPSLGHKQAQNYIISRFKQLALEPLFPDYKQPFSLKGEPGVNLGAFIKGKRYPQEFWVITAHYDHLGQKSGLTYHGANDNASGVAALLALARYFNKQGSNYSLVLLATDAEENGLLGAKYFVKHFKYVNKTRININLDMLGHDAKRKALYAMGNIKGLKLDNIVDKLKPSAFQSEFHVLTRTPRQKRNNIYRINWKNASDHAVFADLGIPYIHFGADIHSSYHKTTDTFEQVKPAFLFASISAIIEILDRLQDVEPSRFYFKDKS